MAVLVSLDRTTVTGCRTIAAAPIWRASVKVSNKLLINIKLYVLVRKQTVDFFYPGAVHVHQCYSSY